MLTIKSKKEIEKFKKVEENQIIYQFDEDVVLDFKQVNMLKEYENAKDEKLKRCKTNAEKMMLVMEGDYRPQIIYKGKNMTFNQDVDWIDNLQLDGNLTCKGEIEGKYFHVEGNVDAKKIVCQSLICDNLTGSYVSIESLFCKGDINCEMFKVDHIISCERLNAGVMTFNGTMLYNVSATGENLGIEK